MKVAAFPVRLQRLNSINEQMGVAETGTQRVVVILLLTPKYGGLSRHSEEPYSTFSYEYHYYYYVVSEYYKKDNAPTAKQILTDNIDT